jgi:hypothetical protein
MSGPAALALVGSDCQHEIPSAARPRCGPRIDAEEKTKGGIIIPDTAKEKPQEGEIVAVGPAAATKPAS